MTVGNAVPAPCIGIVAGEASGDRLGAGLIKALRRRYPEARFVGIGGPRMQALGVESLYEMSSISVIGTDGLFSNLFKILRIRRDLGSYLLEQRPNLFIGIDVPDFNLGLEQRLRRHGLTTVHYVSPTVWAWRGYRIRKIRRAVDHMLALFPFEADYYRVHQVPVTFVGHPMADEIDQDIDPIRAREALGLPTGGQVVALLVGSRASEIRRMGRLFIDTAAVLAQRRDNLRFVAPFVDESTRDLFAELLAGHAQAPKIELMVGVGREAMAASDVVILKSGTASLEAILLGRPAVVTYRVSLIASILIRMFAHVRYYSMPNNLLGRVLIPEFMQENAQPLLIADAVDRFLSDPDRIDALRRDAARIHTMLRQGADERAADAVAGMIESQRAGDAASLAPRGA